VLFIEDSPDLAEMYRLKLELDGYWVRVVKRSGGGRGSRRLNLIRVQDRRAVMYTVLYMAARRTQIYLTAEQRRRLDDRVRREKRSLAELVREAVDVYLADRSGDAAAALDSTFGALPRLKVPSRDEWDRGPPAD
jgi:hypothetical protein